MNDDGAGWAIFSDIPWWLIALAVLAGFLSKAFA
jgi:hypothetical protein